MASQRTIRLSARFNLYGIDAVQFGYEVVRISFVTTAGYHSAMKKKGVHLFGAWCEIRGGGPPVTIVHVFDYPHEANDGAVKVVISDFGDVKSVKRQRHLFDTPIYTGNSPRFCRFVSHPPSVPFY